jgi:small subunit ribosomal protein S2
LHGPSWIVDERLTEILSLTPDARRPRLAATDIAGVPFSEELVRVATALVKQLIEAGVHFGHRASRWNPKMRPYIYGRRNLIHIIDVRETVRGLVRAKKYLSQVAGGGSLVLFVGTKRQAAETVEREAERCGMPYVGERWLGGTLTNFRTIRSRLSRLEQLETMKTTDEISSYSKKMQSALSREYRKMFRNLNGMRTMNRMPECLVVIDPKKEKNCIMEARKLGITTVALIDTDCDPDLVDLPIPGNDDSIRSIELVLQQLASAVLEGKANAVDASAKNVGAAPMTKHASAGGRDEDKDAE